MGDGKVSHPTSAQRDSMTTERSKRKSLKEGIGPRVPRECSTNWAIRSYLTFVIWTIYCWVITTRWSFNRVTISRNFFQMRIQLFSKSSCIYILTFHMNTMKWYLWLYTRAIYIYNRLSEHVHSFLASRNWITLTLYRTQSNDCYSFVFSLSRQFLLFNANDDW